MGEGKSKLRIKNMFLFVIERFCQLIQKNRIVLFYELFFSFLFFFSLNLK